MIQTKNLQFAYNKDRSFSFPDLGCSAGESLLITGRSGCGKTTLLHLLAGILHPADGEIKIGETLLSSLGDADADRFRGACIGLVYQRPHFIASLTVMDNLRLPAYFGHKPVTEDAVQELAEHLGIRHTLRQLPDRLSVGEQQRASIARALVNRPELILADEPTSALDDENCASVFELLTRQAAEHNAALVIVTHDGRLKSAVKNQVELSLQGR
ncbi:MAG: ABC transporter ATP-binding protein [Bacteroidota bacterium]